jgi:hypothetical protein
MAGFSVQAWQQLSGAVSICLAFTLDTYLLTLSERNDLLRRIHLRHGRPEGQH